MSTTTKSPKVVFFGNEQLASGTTSSLPVLNALVDAGYTVCAIVLNSHHVTSRNKKPSTVEQFASKHSIPVLKPAKPSQIIDELRGMGADCGVLAAYGRIVSQQLIDIFPHGIINLHPSLLPKHRGPTPIEQAIIDGDEYTGVSVMSLSSGMDEGPIYAQQSIKLAGTETKQQLADQLGKLGSELIINAIPRIMTGQLQPTPQPQTGASYCQLLTKGQSTIDPAQFSAAQIERQVRAFAGFPKSRLQFNDHQIIVTQAHVRPTPQHQLSVQCTDGQYLVIDSLTAPSGKQMLATDFIRGYLK